MLSPGMGLRKGIQDLVGARLDGPRKQLLA